MENPKDPVTEEKSPTHSTAPPAEKPTLTPGEGMKQSTQRTLEALNIAAREKKSYD